MHSVPRTQCQQVQSQTAQCNTLQRTATHCATHCNTRSLTNSMSTGTDQDSAHARSVGQHLGCNTLQRSVAHCNILQHTMSHLLNVNRHRARQHAHKICRTTPGVSTRISRLIRTMDRVAGIGHESWFPKRFSCVAMCCSVFQCRRLVCCGGWRELGKSHVASEWVRWGSPEPFKNLCSLTVVFISESYFTDRSVQISQIMFQEF